MEENIKICRTIWRSNWKFDKNSEVEFHHLDFLNHIFKLYRSRLEFRKIRSFPFCSHSFTFGMKSMMHRISIVWCLLHMIIIHSYNMHVSMFLACHLLAGCVVAAAAAALCCYILPLWPVTMHGNITFACFLSPFSTLPIPRSIYLSICSLCMAFEMWYQANALIVLCNLIIEPVIIIIIIVIHLILPISVFFVCWLGGLLIC